MAEKRGTKRDTAEADGYPNGEPAGEEEEEEEEEVSIIDRAVGEQQDAAARTELRRRWELASVLNFLHVFKPIIGGELKLSAEEIEKALIAPNNDLAQIHIALLKGIPPISKNLNEADLWVTTTCKKLSEWWHWVAEGDNPLKPDHGEEIVKYKELDAKTRLLILKALCELRAEQDDVLRYVSDSLKTGTDVSTFRKGKIGISKNDTNFWYDGDPVIGYRLYKETTKITVNQNTKNTIQCTGPMIDCHWETIATNLAEFQEISEKLSESINTVEVGLAQTIKSDIVPVLQKLQMKKERALNRLQRQTMQLNGFVSNTVGSRCSRRGRRPVNYSFDDFDRTINEAIRLSEISEDDEMLSNGNKLGHRSLSSASSGNSDEEDYDAEGDYGDGDQDGTSEDDFDEERQDDSDKEREARRDQANVIPAQNKRPRMNGFAQGLRRSGRLSGGYDDYNGEITDQVEARKRLRQRPIKNTNHDRYISDSDDLDDDEKFSGYISDNPDDGGSKEHTTGMEEDSSTDTDYK